MQTTIKVTCPGCGDLTVARDDVLVVCFTFGGGDYYQFFCQKCATTVRKPATDTVVNILRGGGVPLRVVDRPAEALEPHDGPALTCDDLLDFALGLRGIDFPTELIN